MSALVLTRVRLRLEALAQGTLPGTLAAPMRAAWGPALRQVACPREPACAQVCVEPRDCAFGLAFTALPPVAGWGGTPPRSLWLQHDLLVARHLSKGDHVEIGLVLAPAAAEHLPVLVDGLRVAAARGIDRIPFAVERSGEPERWTLERATEEAGSWEDCRAVTVRLLTPLRLKVGGRLLTRAPELCELVGNLASRASALSAAHGGSSGVATTALRSAAEEARVAHGDVRWLRLARPRHGRTPDSMSGLVGEVLYRDVPQAVHPWLVLAGVLHAGADAMVGCGRVAAAPASRVITDAESMRLAASLAVERVRAVNGPLSSVAVDYPEPDHLLVRIEDPASAMAELRDLAEALDVRISVRSR
ncbi:MAG: CRISPR system precrRNA processing endoribonuclease RAMP protein Cas6 [Egibacteraceae bacterium]